MRWESVLMLLPAALVCGMAERAVLLAHGSPGWHALLAVLFSAMCAAAVGVARCQPRP